MKTSAVMFSSSKLSSMARSALLAAATSGLCLSAMAANINQVADATDGGATWNTVTAWSNGEAPSVANDYFTNGFNLSSQHAAWLNGQGTVTFAGNSLTVNNGSRLTLRANIINISNLTLGAGSVRNAASPSSGVNVASLVNVGTLRLSATQGAPTTVEGAWGGNNVTFKALNLAGDGFLRFTSARTFTLDVGSATGFTGGFEVAATATAIIAGSDLLINSGSFVMATGSFLTLNQNLSVASFSFGGTDLDAGIYNSAQLNAFFSTSAFSGDGSVAVAIPEASTSALIGAVTLCLVIGARRKLIGARAAR